MADPDAVSRPLPPPGTVVLTVHGPIDPAQVSRLCDEIRRVLEDTGALIVDCDVATLAEPDVGAVDGLARMSLTASRLGRRVRLRNASPQLRELILLAGLVEVMPCA